MMQGANGACPEGGDIMWIETLGLMAATLTTIAFVPQVVQVWRSRSAADIPLAMYSLFTTGIGLWFVYGVLIKSTPIIAANAVTFILALMVIIMKLRFERSDSSAPPKA